MKHVGSWAQVCALLGIVLSLIGCAKSAEDNLPAPTGQYAVTTSGYDAVVEVILPGGSGLCTGTFVSPRVVLTASHCTQTAGTYRVIASFGTFETSSRVTHGPGLVNDPNDIALLVFDTNVASAELGQVYPIATSVSSGDKLRLVGFGCNDVYTRRGAGVKRTGTNVVYDVNEYIEFLTPDTSTGRGILGAENRAGSCFGDSGGPALREVAGGFEVVGVTHAGGTWGEYLISQYINVASDSSNRNFIATNNTNYALGIGGF